VLSVESDDFDRDVFGGESGLDGGGEDGGKRGPWRSIDGSGCGGGEERAGSGDLVGEW
jgi:hypothetical protein